MESNYLKDTAINQKTLKIPYYLYDHQKVRMIDHKEYCLDYHEFYYYYQKITENSDEIVLLDTRPDDDALDGIIPKSVLVNMNFTLNKLINKNSKILLVTEEGYEEESITRLNSQGYHNILGFLDGGIDCWISNKKVLTIPKTVQKIETFQKLDALIDCREPREWNYGVMGCKDVFLTQIDAIPKSYRTLDLDRTYGVYCKRGMRSFAVSTFLMSKGLNVWNIPGGIINWVFRMGKGSLVKKLK